MKVIVLGGSGAQGKAVAFDLAQNENVEQIVLADLNKSALDHVAGWINSPKCKTTVVDCSKEHEVTQLIESENAGAIVCSVPWQITLPPLNAAIKCGVNFVDFGLYHNKEFDNKFEEYDKKAKKAGTVIIPSCGLAPGITNMLAAYGVSKLDSAHTVEVFDGGNPEKPEPPLFYKTVWSIEGVWAQFTGSCWIIKDGIPTTIEAVSGLEKLEFEGLGNFEVAYTECLGTMLHAYKHPVMKGVKNAFGKTIRWPGHYEKIKTLKECGFLDDEPITCNGGKISPRKFLTALLEPLLRMEAEQRDMTLVRVNSCGFLNGEETTYSFELIDYKDLETGLLSMARTTGFTGSILVDLIGKKKIKEPGIIMPEQIGGDSTLFKLMIEEYRKRNILIKEL